MISDFSLSRSVGARQINHPLCGCALNVIQKISKRDTIKVFKPIVKRKEQKMAQKAHSLSHTKWICSITLCSPLSIDEKSSIINIEVV
ncbi:partial transposase [Streptococcus mutans LJ23]|nr:partial transposase [Streptococcus mutans LJ23]